MNCRLLNLLTVLSLLLCVAVCVLWVRSGRHQDNIGWGSWAHDSGDFKNQERWFAGVADSRGILAVGALREREGGPIQGPLVRTGAGFFWNENGWPLNGYIGVASAFHGFAFLWLSYDPTPGYLGHHGLIVCVPFWAATLITAALPIARYRHIQRRRRRRQREATGLCPDCGYDLRGNESGMCPECGGVAAGAATARPGVVAERQLPPLWQRATAWVLVWLAAGMIILAASPDLRRVLRLLPRRAAPRPAAPPLSTQVESADPVRRLGPAYQRDTAAAGGGMCYRISRNEAQRPAEALSPGYAASTVVTAVVGGGTLSPSSRSDSM